MRIGFCDTYRVWVCTNGHKFKVHFNAIYPLREPAPDRCSICGSECVSPVLTPQEEEESAAMHRMIDKLAQNGDGQKDGGGRE